MAWVPLGCTRIDGGGFQYVGGTGLTVDEAIVRAWSGERGARSRDFESGEQELPVRFL